MIINSDERQWTWMDEGLNTFVQHRAQVENYPDMPERRGPAPLIVPYMKSSKDIHAAFDGKLGTGGEKELWQ